MARPTLAHGKGRRMSLQTSASSRDVPIRKRVIAQGRNNKKQRGKSKRGKIIHLRDYAYTPDRPKRQRQGMTPAEELAEARKFGVSPEMLAAARKIDEGLRTGELTITQAARRSGLADATIRKYLKTFKGEDGTRNPQIASIKFLLRALGGRIEVVWD